ncbi:hypothetical protein CYV26_10830 [Carnobacterium maltaromaticum]|uniref:YesL family protein n=1 Tax=Carnobacterium maltaromaticum TaxID=2751 RepID=UPI000C7735BE|nr:DUF624 domain-containing protein [Carnobacterium maltaromaticum]PLS34003.1 hypothetical protein CYV30_11995 [Carnobacterium maltaromaticum]PLS34138.1 hypothetical protein CYV33_10815 [Carnobacterium maltaromaticum]PLS34274.1 hypothetical protein CYV31_11975 [Carnobacterium maltaromaticum]PLS41602.1 hypothetical protein CYV28_11930 [Carnobacterium maltaromaticum]PLS43084.1 hypothetical protein CYV27_10815 [Carnobacterium maltaromaticum]
MLGKYLETFFNRCYLFIKLSLIFWGLSFTGGLIFGVGPALVTIASLFLEYRWEYKQMNKATWWKIYKENFKKSTILFYIFGAISVFLAYNLYLSVQISGLLFLMIDFLIIFALVILSSAFWFSVLIQSQYDCSIKDTLKLAAILSFMSFKNTLVLTIGGVVLIMITYKFPGLILFGSIGFWIIFVANVSQPLFTKLDEQLVSLES